MDPLQDALEDPHARAGAFDVVLLLGVLARVRAPLCMLRAAARGAKELLVVETLIRTQRAAELSATLETMGFAQVALHRRAQMADLPRRALPQRRLVVHCRR